MENDDFGDFGDENDDFGDFDGFESAPLETEVEIKTEIESSLKLGPLPSDILELIPKKSNSLISNENPSENNSEKNKEIVELFDCVNASSLELCWRDCSFDQMLSAATPLLIEICKSKSCSA